MYAKLFLYVQMCCETTTVLPIISYKVTKNNCHHFKKQTSFLNLVWSAQSNTILRTNYQNNYKRRKQIKQIYFLLFRRVASLLSVVFPLFCWDLCLLFCCIANNRASSANRFRSRSASLYAVVHLITQCLTSANCCSLFAKIKNPTSRRFVNHPPVSSSILRIFLPFWPHTRLMSSCGTSTTS